MDAKKETKPLLDKVRKWLETQGYPLEFRVASAFSTAGVPAEQGLYVQEAETSPAREIDVVAEVRETFGVSRICRIAILVECKWSREKPWVVFTTRRTRMASSACIAQTIGSVLGRAVTHCLAANEDLRASEVFTSGELNGFGGRRAFSNEKEPDVFHATVKSIVTKTIAYATHFDEHRVAGQMPNSCVIALPMIVLEGDLFQAYFDSEANEMRLDSVDSIRLHWRGTESPGPWISTLDIVKFESLNSLISRRKPEWERLKREALAVISQIDLCYKRQSLSALEIKPVPRGYLYLPKLLQELANLSRRP